MVGEFLFNVLYTYVSALFAVLPDFSWSVDEGIMSLFLDFVSVAMYLLPSTTVIYILGLTIWFQIFRILVATLRTIWDILPLL